MLKINKKIASQFIAFSRTFRSEQQGFFSVLANLFAKNQDYNSNIISPQSFGIDDWFDKDDNQQFLDGTIRLLTQLDIDSNPQWIGKYLAGINTRDDVCKQEAVYAAYANQGSKARGTISAIDITNIASGIWTCTLNIDQNVDPTYGLVKSLPISPNGLFSQGMRNAMFCVTSGPFKYFLHTVESNTNNTVTFNEQTGALYLPSVGDSFELVQFNGDLYKSKNREIDLLGFYYQLSRAIVIQFTAGAKFLGCGMFNTTIQQNTQDLPILACNGMEFSKVIDVSLIHDKSSNRALIDLDFTGPSFNSDTRAVTANQSNSFDKVLFGTNPAGTWQNRLGSSGATIALTGSGTVGGKGYVEITAPRNILLNEFVWCWVVIASSTDKRRIGWRYLVGGHLAANNTTTLRLIFNFEYPSSNQPTAGDGIFIEVGTHAGIEFGNGRIQTLGATGPQGSENMVTEFYAGGFSTAAFVSTTGNALQQSYIHGNIAGCPNWGIYHNWGNAVIVSIGMQSGNDSLRSQFNYLRSDPTAYGADVCIGNAVLENSRLEGIRSESPRLLLNRGAQYVSVEDCECYGQVPNSEWGTNKSISAEGALTFPTTLQGSFSPHRDGGLWVCARINAGAIATDITSSSALNEPQWNLVGNPVGYDFRSVNEVNNAGHTIQWLEIDSYLRDIHNGANVGFKVISGTLIYLKNFRTSFGKIDITGNKIKGRLEVSRKDWYGNNNSGGWQTPKINSATAWEIDADITVNVPSNPPQSFSTYGLHPGPGLFPFESYPTSPRYNVSPKFWVMGSNGTDRALWEGGWGPGDYDDIVISGFGKKNIDSYFSPVYIAPPTPHIVNPYLDWGGFLAGTNDQGTAGLTNIPGRKGWYGGGKGRGNAIGGEIGFVVSPAGAAGTQANPFVEVGKFDLDNTSGNTRFWLYDATTGTLKRIQVGAANSGGVGFRQLIVIN